jgi:thioredoxin reductase (NADPH)
MTATTFDIAVIGGGIAGLTAAHHAALAGVSVAHFVADGLPGGLMMNVGALDGWPAVDRIGGAELAAGLMGRNDEVGVVLVPSRIDAVGGGAAKTLNGPDGTWQARQVIVATGAALRTLDVPGADRLAGRGISQCAWCDGGLYRGADVVVAGGGDSALSEAIHLGEFARTVTIVTRGEAFRARRSYVSRIAGDERFQLKWSSDIVEVLGGDGVESVRVRDRETQSEEVVPCKGLFVFVGLVPNAGLVGPEVVRDARGFVVTDASFETAAPGIFAVGAVRAGYGGRLTQAVAEATTAAEAAAARCDE